ncbi:hypothetical protein BAUCODRAFT_495351 [Baudoinia panamericana UAMH 10762]|uniref:Uncharacterized protein n=1 Tax=Baudoinia panamericana (strain UAMH 10762) TaxID=717646 RepID=M2N940_BAUPA|nr:uncharacterized protein BAUCODRAFT_495351 [Baudoinia panamericana UAMH 10762]EMC95604.1 hypothetical protein BAUCODRAFT_495351 [Baudoinia panamericana UAMH 10762]
MRAVSVALRVSQSAGSMQRMQESCESVMIPKQARPRRACLWSVVRTGADCGNTAAIPLTMRHRAHRPRRYCGEWSSARSTHAQSCRVLLWWTCKLCSVAASRGR